MRKLLLALYLIGLAQPAWAAIAFDNSATDVVGETGNFDFDITPVGTARGLIVYVITTAEGDEISGVTADGSALSEVTDSPILNTTGEDGGTHVFFLGSSIPTGTLTIAITTSGTATTKIAAAITLTADQDTSVVDTNATQAGSDDNPEVPLSLGGVSSFVSIGAWSGIGAVGSITPRAGWTSRLEHDFGATTGLCYTYDTVSTVDVTAGYDQSGDDVALHAIAIRENAAAGGDRRAVLM